MVEWVYGTKARKPCAGVRGACASPVKCLGRRGVKVEDEGVSLCGTETTFKSLRGRTGDHHVR